MTTNVSVSVIIPAFNAATTLVRALDSVKAQSVQPIETIVVDDFSTDDTRVIVEAYGGAVRLISLPTQRGAAAARNVGIAEAKGDAIAFLDSDDEWLSEKLEAQIEVLTSSPAISFVACAANAISQEGKNLGDIYRNHPVTEGPQAWRALLAFNFIATPTVLAWRRNVLAAGGFDEKLKIGEDQDLWIKLALSGEFGYVSKTLVKVYLRQKSLSNEVLSDPVTYTIPMIIRHVEKLKSELSKKEIRHILGKRFGLIGRAAYARGDYRNGLRLIGHSVARGYAPFESLFYIASASPPAVWLKRKLGLGRPW